MRSAVPVAICAIAFALALSPGDASAATTKKAKTSTVTKSSASKTKAKASHSRKGTTRKSSAKAGPAAALLPELSQSQLDVSQLVQIGRADCEFAQSVDVEPDITRFGAFRVKFKDKVYKMVPEATATGAVRLHDPSAGIVWLQIPVKSMLMNMNAGQRMVDACTQPAQRSAQSEAEARARAAAARLSAQAAAIAGGATPSAPAEPSDQPLPLLKN